MTPHQAGRRHQPGVRDGVRDVFTAAQVRAAEDQLLADVPPGALMHRAAAGLAAACVDLLGSVYGRQVLVLAGSGNNGGDALFAGARLARRGARVSALLLSPEQVHTDGLAALRAAGGQVVASLAATPGGAGCDLALDGIVGIGASGGLRPAAAAVWQQVQAMGCPVVAVDIPSGVGVDDGTAEGGHVVADLTVTFGAYKLGLLVGAGARAAGAVQLVDIGLDAYLPAPTARALTRAGVAHWLRAAGPTAASHKYSRGVVGVAAGSAHYTGAGLLAVAGASCGLAGMVRYAGPVEVADLVRAHHPEVVLGEGRVQAWVVGSGGGGDAEAVLARARADEVPLVVDADALQHVAGPLGVPALFTPHAGELARMLDEDRAAVEADPLRFARQAATRFESSVLLKGDHTVVAPAPGPTTESSPVLVNTTGTPWLATAGAGDVLAGLCGALLATRPDNPDQVGAVAAWLHGAAASYASQGGPITAGDVARALPAVIRDVLVGS